MAILAWIIIGGIAGWLASIVMGNNAEQGVVGNIIVGIIGALIGGFVSTALGGPSVSGFNLTSLIVATLGAILLLAILRMFRRPAVR
jgi:uncharacterized membrane protein YeaQ/YmgE (transglycosylase-associated protein family)